MEPKFVFLLDKTMLSSLSFFKGIYNDNVDLVIRFSNTFTTTKRKEAFTEATGRTLGWWSLWVKKQNDIN